MTRTLHEDIDATRRAASSQTAANSQRAAMARLLLHVLDAGPDVRPSLPVGDGDLQPKLEQLTSRIAELEGAMAKAEVPDVAALEETIADLKARLSYLEEALGGAVDSKPKASGKSRSKS